MTVTERPELATARFAVPSAQRTDCETLPTAMPVSSLPAVSVVLPVYNGKSYLRAAVDSVLAQTFTDFELIAVDDGSNDGSLQILQEYGRRDPRVRIISRPNTGIAGALNDGIRYARAPLIARMDADDISLPGRFEKQVAYFSEHPDVVLLGGRVLLVDPYDTPVYESDHKLTHEEIETMLLSGVGWAVVHPATMMRTAAVRDAGPYRSDRVPSEDLDLFLRLIEHGRAANLPDVLLRYRQHARSSNHTRAVEQNRLKGTIVREAHDRRGLMLPVDWVPPQRRIISYDRELDMWGWSALRSGHLPAARKHAISLIRKHAVSKNAWKLLFCAIRGW